MSWYFYWVSWVTCSISLTSWGSLWLLKYGHVNEPPLWWLTVIYHSSFLLQDAMKCLNRGVNYWAPWTSLPFGPLTSDCQTDLDETRYSRLTLNVVKSYIYFSLIWCLLGVALYTDLNLLSCWLFNHFWQINYFSICSTSLVKILSCVNSLHFNSFKIHNTKGSIFFSGRIFPVIWY